MTFLDTLARASHIIPSLNLLDHIFGRKGLELVYALPLVPVLDYSLEPEHLLLITPLTSLLVFFCHSIQQDDGKMDALFGG